MDIKEALELFRGTGRTLAALRHALTVMEFDGMTASPKNSAAGRAEASAALSLDMHRLSLDPRRMEALDVLFAHCSELTPALRREALLCRRSLDRVRRIPEELFAGHRLLTGKAFAVWQEAKTKDDFALLAPYLDEVFESARRLASFADPGADPYEYWLNENEEGASRDMLEAFFGRIKKNLPPLIEAAAARPLPRDILHGSFDISAQRRISEGVMALMGIDTESCSLAEAEHPYTTVIGRRDVRISTHYYKGYVAANLFSVLHEGGHALYALGLSPELDGTELAAPASAAVNESQSRFYENIIGRSEAFSSIALPLLRESFPEEFRGVGASELFSAFNVVRPTLKRTEADELTYCLHIMIRYELEKRLMDGSLPVCDIPREWNRLYGEYLGLSVPSDREGCLQDMHWASGLIGYFPTYALGNAYAAGLYHAMTRELDVPALVQGGNIPAVTEWLRLNIHRHGRLYPPAELIENACGEAFSPSRYVDYLKTRFFG